MCTLTLGAWAKGCQDISGVRFLYAIDKSARITDEITYTVTAGAITITGTGGTAYKLEPVQNSVSITNPTNSAPDSNSLFYLQSLSAVLHGNSAALAALVENINKGRTEWLIELTDGTYRMMGTDTNGLQADGGDGFASGLAAGDAKAATISLSGQSTYIAPVLASFDSFTNAFTVTEP
jgi:hypothetical protein